VIITGMRVEGSFSTVDVSVPVKLVGFGTFKVVNGKLEKEEGILPPGKK